MGFAFVLAALTAVLFALLPALQATRFDVAPRAARRKCHRRSAARVAASGSGRRAGRGRAAAARRRRPVPAIAAGGGHRGRRLQRRTRRHAADRHAHRRLRRRRRHPRRRSPDRALQASRASRRWRVADGAAQGGGLGLGGLRAAGYIGADGSDEIDADWDVGLARLLRRRYASLAEGRPFDDAGSRGRAVCRDRERDHGDASVPGAIRSVSSCCSRLGPKASRARCTSSASLATAKYQSIGEAPRNFIYVPLAQQFRSEITFYVVTPARPGLGRSASPISGRPSSHSIRCCR